MIYYFAYGSNLHHSQMKKRCPESFYIKKIVLNNFQLTFRNKGGWTADVRGHPVLISFGKPALRR